MYYNSNKQANDYYNSYKREMHELEAYRKQGSRQKIIKIIFLLITLILLILSTFYLYKFFYPSIDKSKRENIQSYAMVMKRNLPIIINKEELPQSPQLHELELTKVTTKKVLTPVTVPPESSIVKDTQQTNHLNSKDIKLIVQIIMSQINTKDRVSLEEQLTSVETKHFTPTPLKESNHYNKVILSESTQENREFENHQLSKFSDELNNLLNESLDNGITTTDYSTSIRREIATRTNEMRIIIVQKGDTLSRIAKRAYGNYNAYPKIFSANPEIIKNPNQIFVGQKLRIPS